MSTADRQDHEIESLLKKARPARPSDGLKQRVLGEARAAWIARPEPALRRIALRRLAVSAAAAVFIVVLANVWSDSVVTQSSTPRPVPLAREADTQPQWANEQSAIPYGSLLGRVSAVRRPAAADPRALLNYIQSLRNALNQIEDNGTAGSES